MKRVASGRRRFFVPASARIPYDRKQTDAAQTEQTVAGTQKAAGSSAMTPRAFGPLMTCGLFVLLVVMLVSLWALFISGPARLQDARVAETIAAIEDEVAGIRDLQENKFEYVTWQGHTNDTLYWFDALGKTITTRPLSALDYKKARAEAMDGYGMQADTVRLAYGYSAPVYLLENQETILMLDFDSMDWVYERSRVNAFSK